MSQLFRELDELHGSLGVTVLDGMKAKGVEAEADIRERKALLRRFGYKVG